MPRAMHNAERHLHAFAKAVDNELHLDNVVRVYVCITHADSVMAM